MALIAIATLLVACSGTNTPTQTPNLLSTTVTATPQVKEVREQEPATDSLPAPTDSSVEPTADTLPTPIPTDTPTVSHSDTASEPPPAPAVIQHTIQSGETLLGLAMDYGISMATIQLANSMGNSINLIAGQTLSIPGNPQWPDESPFWTLHVVQAGETLVGLAKGYDLTVDEILRVNAIADPTLIHIDQQLIIPLTQLVTLQAPQPTLTPAAIAAAPMAANAQPAPTPAESETVLEAAVAATEPPPPAPPPAQPSGPADWPGYILARINQVRAEHGLNTLTIAPELAHAAQAHAQDCVQRGWGSHVGSDGAVLKTRLERAGYFGSNRGENWVQALNAERAFDWWYGEIPPNDPHRRNILSPYYTEIGIGIAETGWGYVFVTDFGRRQ